MNSVKSGLVVLIYSSIISLVSSQREGYCLTNDNEPYLLFSTKTAYEFVKGREYPQYDVPECKPLMFWSFNRHATRLPSRSDMDELPKLGLIRDNIVANYKERKTAPDQGRLCDQDLESLRSWSWHTNFTSDVANDLTNQGYDDMKFLALRWKSKLRDVLLDNYNPSHYLFRYTNKKRTESSYKAFVDGLFGRGAYNNIPKPDVQEKDSLLRLYDYCKTWKDEVENNPTTYEQTDIFKTKLEYKNMIQNVSTRLGYKYALDEKFVKNMYDMCRYDKAWEIHKVSPWCSAFTKDQLQLLEYNEDLKYYYLSGYGSKLNKKLGCTPLKDLMDRFTAMIEHPELNQPKVIVYFTHSKMVQALITALGIYEDSVPLLADNYHTPHMQRRKWRTSRIDPFASNLAAILYQCNDSERYKVMFYLNEVPVDFDDCRVGLCSWNVLKRKYGRDVDNCNLNYCKGGSGKMDVSIISVVTAFLFILTQRLT